MSERHDGMDGDRKGVQHLLSRLECGMRRCSELHGSLFSTLPCFLCLQRPPRRSGIQQAAPVNRILAMAGCQERGQALCCKPSADHKRHSSWAKRASPEVEIRLLQNARQMLHTTTVQVYNAAGLHDRGRPLNEIRFAGENDPTSTGAERLRREKRRRVVPYRSARDASDKATEDINPGG